MRTSESIKNGGKCPLCGGEMKEDRKGRGFVAHKYPVMLTNQYGERVQCTYGQGERD